MRLVTYELDGELNGEPSGRARLGAHEGDRVRDLTGPTGLRSARALLAEGRLAEAAGARGDLIDAQEVRLGLPVADPYRILCVGVNYMDRNAEYADGSAAPERPSLFMRTPLSFVGHDSPIVRPRESEQLDYEGEITMVIGRAGRRIPENEAMAHVAGLTLMNEGTIRDWLRHGKFNVTQGKNFDRTGAIGPWLETDLSGIDVTDMALETRVNGEVRQADTTASMAFPFARLIAYISTFTTLQPGDVIATGTPTGAGARFDPPRWLTPGDVVEVESPALGVLRNRVADEDAR